MDKNYRINYRVPEMFREKVGAIMTEKEWGDSEFMLMVLNRFFNPEIKYVDREVEVEKIVEKEVIREVLIDSEGTIHESNDRTIDLDPKVYESFNAKKLSSMSMQDYANNFMWEKLENSRKWFEQNSKQKTQGSGASQTPQSEAQTSSPAFEEFRQLKIDCETPEDWKELIVDIKNSTLTEKQKNLLINTPFR